MLKVDPYLLLILSISSLFGFNYWLNMPDHHMINTDAACRLLFAVNWQQLGFQEWTFSPNWLPLPALLPAVLTWAFPSADVSLMGSLSSLIWSLIAILFIYKTLRFTLTPLEAAIICIICGSTTQWSHLSIINLSEMVFLSCLAGVVYFFESFRRNDNSERGYVKILSMALMINLLCLTRYEGWIFAGLLPLLLFFVDKKLFKNKKVLLTLVISFVSCFIIILLDFLSTGRFLPGVLTNFVDASLISEISGKAWDNKVEIFEHLSLKHGAFIPIFIIILNIIIFFVRPQLWGTIFLVFLFFNCWLILADKLAPLSRYLFTSYTALLLIGLTTITVYLKKTKFLKIYLWLSLIIFVSYSFYRIEDDKEYLVSLEPSIEAANDWEAFSRQSGLILLGSQDMAYCPIALKHKLIYGDSILEAPGAYDSSEKRLVYDGLDRLKKLIDKENVSLFAFTKEWAQSISPQDPLLEELIKKAHKRIKSKTDFGTSFGYEFDILPNAP